MTDVRLTATNPEDSSVVPVACNAKGELKLEEVPTFDGNLEGDLHLEGDLIINTDKITLDATGGGGMFSDEIQINSDTTSGYFARFYSGGNSVLMIEETADAGGVPSKSAIVRIGKGGPGRSIAASGGAEFAGNVNSNSNVIIEGLSSQNGFYARVGNSGEWGAKILADGAVVFAGNKAGFTSQGLLWCTTERGDTVKLTATVGGAGMWEAYTPPSRISDLKDKWSEKDVIRPVPEESSQDQPGTTQ